MSAIDLYARHTAGFEDRLALTEALLREALATHGAGLVQSSSLGAEDMVITDLIARLGLGLDVATLDTGKLHAETLALLARIQERYGITVARFAPREEQVITFVKREGDDAMYRSIELRKACCGIRKLEPLSRMLDGRSAWITGLRREQSANRAEVPFDEADGDARRKLNVLAAWSWNDVWHYIKTFDVPYNPLHDEFMPSIGCAPCTRAIKPGEHPRAGRWWWEDPENKECGLHLPQS